MSSFLCRKVQKLFLCLAGIFSFFSFLVLPFSPVFAQNRERVRDNLLVQPQLEGPFFPGGTRVGVVSTSLPEYRDAYYELLKNGQFVEGTRTPKSEDRRTDIDISSDAAMLRENDRIAVRMIVPAERPDRQGRFRDRFTVSEERVIPPLNLPTPVIMGLVYNGDSQVRVGNLDLSRYNGSDVYMTLKLQEGNNVIKEMIAYGEGDQRIFQLEQGRQLNQDQRIKIVLEAVGRNPSQTVVGRVEGRVVRVAPLPPLEAPVIDERSLVDGESRLRGTYNANYQNVSMTVYINGRNVFGLGPGPEAHGGVFDIQLLDGATFEEGQRVAASIVGNISAHNATRNPSPMSREVIVGRAVRNAQGQITPLEIVEPIRAGDQQFTVLFDEDLLNVLMTVFVGDEQIGQRAPNADEARAGELIIHIPEERYLQQGQRIRINMECRNNPRGDVHTVTDQASVQAAPRQDALVPPRIVGDLVAGSRELEFEYEEPEGGFAEAYIVVYANGDEAEDEIARTHVRDGGRLGILLPENRPLRAGEQIFIELFAKRTARQPNFQRALSEGGRVQEPPAPPPVPQIERLGEAPHFRNLPLQDGGQEIRGNYNSAYANARIKILIDGASVNGEEGELVPPEFVIPLGEPLRGGQRVRLHLRATVDPAGERFGEAESEDVVVEGGAQAEALRRAPMPQPQMGPAIPPGAQEPQQRQEYRLPEGANEPIKPAKFKIPDDMKGKIEKQREESSKKSREAAQQKIDASRKLAEQAQQQSQEKQDKQNNTDNPSIQKSSSRTLLPKKKTLPSKKESPILPIK